MAKSRISVKILLPFILIAAVLLTLAIVPLSSETAPVGLGAVSSLDETSETETPESEAAVPCAVSSLAEPEESAAESVASEEPETSRMPESAAPPAERPEIETSSAPESETSSTASASGPDVAAKYAMLTDAANGRVLYQQGGTESRLYPASTTKLFTAYVALQYLEPEEIITAGDELELLQPGSSIAYILRGHRLSVEMLVEGMLLPSGNDAAYILAAAAGRKIAGDEALAATPAVEAFVGEMNRQAENHGLSHTHFVCPDGYHDDEHYTTLADAVDIARLALSNDLIVRYASMASDKVYYASGENITWTNTNQLIQPDSPYYCEEAIGLKTGFTDEAGYCLLAAARFGPSEVIVAVFGSDSSEARFSTAAELLEYYRTLL